MTVRPWHMQLVVLLSVGLGACSIEEVPRPSRVDLDEVTQEQISATLDAYRNALLAGDAAAVAATFAPDGRLYQPDQPDLIGRDDIRAGMQRSFQGAAVKDLLIGREQVDIGEDSIAHEWGTFEETVQMSQQPPTVLHGRYSIRWRRGPQAQWFIERMLFNNYPTDTTAAR